MRLFKRKNLYRVEITGICYASFMRGMGGPMPSIDQAEKSGNYGQIPVGTRGWVIEKFGKKYFRPDEDQEGIELFTDANQPIILVPYNKIEGCYRKIPDNE